MYRSENANDAVERDPRNDPRSRPSDEIVIERKPIIADRSREPDDEVRGMPSDRRRGERRRIERMGTDI